MNDERIPLKKLIGYFSEKKSLGFIAAALILGILLMLFGRGGDAVVFSSSSETAVETRIRAICERISGVSEVTVMVTLDKEGDVSGVAIVCSGGDEAGVRLKLTRMICSLFGIGSDSVSIIGTGG